jgi:hypothetical protein
MGSDTRVDAILNYPSIAALRREERILSLKLAEQLAHDPDAFRRALAAAEAEIAAAHSESLSVRVDQPDPPMWQVLKGVKNTDEILTLKASVVARVIIMRVEDGESVFSVLSKDDNSYPTITRQACLKSRSEIAAFYFHIVQRFVHVFLSVQQQSGFMLEVKRHLVERVESVGISPGGFSELCRDRCVEYSKYERLFIEIRQPGRPLLWDFSDRVSVILGVPHNYLFMLMLTNFLLRRIADADLRRLLTGEFY